MQIYFVTARITKGLLDNSKGGQYDAGGWVIGQPANMLIRALGMRRTSMGVPFSFVAFNHSLKALELTQVGIERKPGSRQLCAHDIPNLPQLDQMT